jgi:hypothetical protein
MNSALIFSSKLRLFMREALQAANGNALPRSDGKYNWRQANALEHKSFELCSSSNVHIYAHKPSLHCFKRID